MNKAVKYAIMFIFLSCFACKKEAVKPIANNLPVNNTTTPSDVGSKPEKYDSLAKKTISFSFNVDSAIIVEGDSFISVSPILSTGYQSIKYFLDDTTLHQHFQINKDYSITILPTFPKGKYEISALVNATDSLHLFSKVYSLTINPGAVKNIYYVNNNLVLDKRKYYETEIPIVIGSKPITFLISSKPEMPSIGIDNVTGKIIVEESVLPGNYEISISTRNAKGFRAFNQIMTISIGGMLNMNTSAISFKDKISPIINSNCGRCHLDYQKYHIAYKFANNIYDRISRPVGDTKKMPQNSTMPSAEIQLIKQWIDTQKNP
jgi:hypothetical protein